MSGFIKTFNSTLGPKAIGPYSTAKIFNGTLYVSGQIGIDPKTSELVSSDVELQARRALENLKIILSETGVGFEYILKSTIFLTSIDDFAKINAIYAEYFISEPPARSCVAVAQLPKGAKFQIQVICAYPYKNV